MKFNKFISMIMSLVLTVTVNAFPAYAQFDNELFNLYTEYFEDTATAELKDYIVNGYKSAYNIIEKPVDYGVIRFITDSEIEFNTEELADYIGYSNNEFSVSSSLMKSWGQQYLTINLYSDNKEINKDIFTKIYTVLKEKYDIVSAHICMDSVPVSVYHIIKWDSFTRTDEFGYKVSPDEDLSENKINSIRNAIADNNFAVTIDNNGKITFNKSVSEAEKFRFAIWFKKEYDFYVSDNPEHYTRTYNTTEIIHYTELPGDVNNDNVINVHDTDMLREYILEETYTTEASSPYQCFNVKNADLTGDGVIDAFDLVLLRKQLVDSGFGF